MMTGSPPFRILTVCTGNICRSPQAAQLLLARIWEAGERVSTQIEIASAGTHAVLGSGMDPPAAELSREMGGAPDRHRARQLTPAMIDEADLVLCMGREHRSATVRLMPRASRYTFLLTEFTGLLEDFAQNQQTDHLWAGSDVEHLVSQLRRGVRSVATRRGQVPRQAFSLAEIVDPHRAEASVYRQSAQQIQQAVERICQAATGISEARP